MAVPEKARITLFPSGFFCLRTHLLSTTVLSELGDPALGTVASIRTRLAALLAEPRIREALFLASPSLEESLQFWQGDPTSDRGQRAERALVKYLARMASRPTPFGLFAAVATGEIGPVTRLDVPPAGSTTRTTRLDNEYLFKLTAALQKEGSRAGALRYSPNDTRFAAGSGWRYVEARPAKVGHTFHLVEVADSGPLHLLLDGASIPGGRTRDELTASLVEDGIKAPQATRFVDQVIESQLLLSNLGVQVTGTAAAEHLAAHLAGTPEGAAPLEAALAAIRALDSSPAPNSPATYRAIATGLAALPLEPELPRLFQVDLVRPAAGTLGSPVIQELQRGADLLYRLTPHSEDPLTAFAVAFQDRYEGRAVPLLEALDAESGLGNRFGASADPSPLLAGLPLGRYEAPRITWGAREDYLLQRTSALAAAGAIEWELDSADLEALTVERTTPIPDAVAAMATIAAPSETAVSRGEFQLHLQSFDGPSGARLLGRFCHADPALEAQVRQHLRAEEALDPDAIFAEIVHLPEGRIGNVICRPALREYEITFAGRSGLPPERQIPASDLMLSLRDGRLDLHSRRLGRRIIPRLTTAHNFSRGLTAYRFLCQLQMQGTVPFLLWQWGALAASAFLPRVRHGRLVLSLARWTLSKAEIKSLQQGDEAARAAAMAALRQARRLPRWVVLREADNRLPVDLENPLAVEMLVHELHEWPSAILEEHWPDEDRLLATGPEGRFRHEVIVPFSTRREPRPAVVAGSGAAPAVRRFAPGSEWLYLKLYGSPVAADATLVELVAPLSARWSAKGVDRWFFLRYGDPEQHLRWRLHGEPALLQRKVWPAIQKALEPLLETGIVRRVQLDTYEREVERYGGPAAIEWAEQLFHHDSIAVSEMLAQLEPGDGGMDERWQLALRGSDQLMADFGLDCPARLALLDRLAAYGSVPAPDSHLRQQLSGKFRERRSTVESILNRAHDATSPLAPGFEILTQRSSANAPAVAGLRDLAGKGALSERIEGIVCSLVHMQVNRLLRESPNAHETVIYDWLRRVYQSQAARERSG